MTALLIVAIAVNTALIFFAADHLSPNGSLTVKSAEHIADLWLAA